MKVIDPVRYRRIYEEVMKKLDKLENEFLPQVKESCHLATLKYSFTPTNKNKVFICENV